MFTRQVNVVSMGKNLNHNIFKKAKMPTQAGSENLSIHLILHKLRPFHLSTKNGRPNPSEKEIKLQTADSHGDIKDTRRTVSQRPSIFRNYKNYLWNIQSDEKSECSNNLSRIYHFQRGVEACSGLSEKCDKTIEKLCRN